MVSETPDNVSFVNEYDLWAWQAIQEVSTSTDIEAMACIQCSIALSTTVLCKLLLPCITAELHCTCMPDHWEKVIEVTTAFAHVLAALGVQQQQNEQNCAQQNI